MGDQHGTLQPKSTPQVMMSDNFARRISNQIFNQKHYPQIKTAKLRYILVYNLER